MDAPPWWPAMEADLIQLLGTPYKLGAEWDGKVWPPKELDCSELVETVFRRRSIKCPDGSFYQHAESHPASDPRPGDLGFFAKAAKSKKDNPYGVYHVGILGAQDLVYEARERDDKGRYGMVITRPRASWEAYGPFIAGGGWRRLTSVL